MPVRNLGLTVSAIAYEREGRRHYGAGTSFLESLSDGDELTVRRAAAHDFRLPDGTAPVIMIGPGVGIAPFIGFLQEIAARSDRNDAWLFFGDQHRASDWLYESEICEWLDSGVLTKLSLAFSRDQAEKHYVQDEIIADADALRSWVERGAHIYICGDKNHMARDVEQELVRVLDESELPGADGSERLKYLKDAGRYAKDVY